MERDGFCRSVTSKLNYFLPRETEGQDKNRACTCHGFQTGLQYVLPNTMRLYSNEQILNHAPQHLQNQKKHSKFMHKQPLTYQQLIRVLTYA